MYSSLRAYFASGNAVPASPSLPLGTILGISSSGHFLPSPFDQERVVYTFSGAGAIYLAAKVLGLSGDESILCPAYNCGHEIEPFIRQNIKVKLFSIGEGLQADIDHLRRHVDRTTRAVLVTHYFGFPQPLDQLRSFCDEQGLFLIEDCAHSLFSKDGERPLGTVGDLAIFSMRKTLPIPNGGALVVNNPRLKLAFDLVKPPAVGTWSKTMDLWLSSLATAAQKPGRSWSALGLLVAALPFAVARKLARQLPLWEPVEWFDPDDETLRVDKRVYSWQMADIAKRIIAGIDPDFVVHRRRSNFEYLLNALAETNSVQPIYQTLPPGVCPLYFPVLCDQPSRLVEGFAAQNIGSICWWGIFHPDVSLKHFPHESSLKRRVVALPIHQDLTDPQLRLLVDRLRTACQA